MKVILSRKGFDSTSGGHPSPVFYGKIMLPIPIPISGSVEMQNSVVDTLEEHKNSERGVRYSNLQLPNCIKLEGYSCYYKLMEKLYPEKELRLGKKSKFLLDKYTLSHPDPDLDYCFTAQNCENKKRKQMFGQVGGAQTHLCKQGVGKGALFLFYGLYQHVCTCGEPKLVGQPFHAIWGYLEVGDVLCNKRIRNLENYHIHKQSFYLNKENNTIYEATTELSFDKSRPGAGIFPFHENRVLTKPDESVSKWKLPEFLSGLKISHHPKENTKIGFQTDGNGGYFQSTSPGQEFVIEEHKKVDGWVKGELFQSN